MQEVAAMLVFILWLAFVCFILIWRRLKARQGPGIAPFPQNPERGNDQQTLCDRDPIDFVVLPDGNVLYFKGTQEREGPTVPDGSQTPDIPPSRPRRK